MVNFFKEMNFLTEDDSEGTGSVLGFMGPVENRGDSKRTEIISQIFESN